jgi:signal transduction histidine kinase/CheY-like chemotaxis protein
VGYIVDMSKTVRHGRLLAAVNEVAAMFMAAADETKAPDKIADALRILSLSINVDRAFLWRNDEEDGVLYSTQLAAWRCRGEAPPLRRLPFDNVLRDMPGIRRDGLIDTINVKASDLPPGAVDSQATAGMKSLLVTPIILAGRAWGFITFEDYTQERLFEREEEDIIMSGGMLIASSLVRAEMVESLIKAREEALASTNAKSEFLSRMSHEIRTPMNAIIGMAAIARKSADMERVLQCLNRIDDSSRQLLSIINDVLDMSKIESGKFEISVNEFSFEKMLEHVVNVMQVKLDEKHQEFRLVCENFFRRNMIADELRLSQVLINLLTNAIKFTPDYGKIAVFAGTEGSGDSSVLRVRVKDNGIGISAEQKSKLFNSFEQADGSITRQFGGTGLGLAICKKIINLMGGDIWVESEPGCGASFIFEIEVRWGDQIDYTRKNISDNLRLLVVDDSDEVLDYFTNMLMGFSMTCDTASSGTEALRLVRGQKPYDIVFLDWSMPVMNGLETAREIISLTDGASEIVMISVVDRSDIREKMDEIGIKHFLPKPILPSMLYDKIVQISGTEARARKTQLIEEVHDWSGHAVLLVEDIAINREIIIALLEETGLNIKCAENGLEAVRCFEAGEHFDLVLMDVQMPIMDGLAAARHIRALPARHAREVPIVAMTANAFKEDVDQCIKAGMNNHVAKPVEVDMLMRVLTEYLGA